ncbi:DUF2461 domain-containing protein [Candidatus Kapaibacterium sp.]
MSKISEFDNFSRSIANFFKELSLNNNKQWFDDHRNFYEQEIKDKSKLFVSRMSKDFEQENLPLISDSKLSLFRINRDIRFSANKDPYKTNMGIFFPYSENPFNVNKDTSLGLYIHYEVDQSFIACGIHNPDSEQLKKVRYAVANDYENFKTIVNEKSFEKHFPEMFALLKPVTRVAGYSKDHPAFEHICRKDFTYGVYIDDDLVFDIQLPEFIIEKAKAAKPFLAFLYHAING